MEVGKKFLVHKLAEIIAGKGAVVVEGAGFVLRRGPRFPAVGWVEEVGVIAAFELRLGRAVLLEAVEVFQEQKPRGLLGVVEFRGAARFLAEGIVDVAKGLFKHGWLNSWRWSSAA